MQLFDTHCHLDEPAFEGDRQEVLARAREAGVIGMLSIGTTALSSVAAVELARREADVFAAVGIQPNYVAEEYYADENHYRNFVVFDNAKSGWVRNTTALHFVNSMVGTQRGSKWITVQDCARSSSDTSVMMSFPPAVKRTCSSTSGRIEMGPCMPVIRIGAVPSP